MPAEVSASIVSSAPLLPKSKTWLLEMPATVTPRSLSTFAVARGALRLGPNFAILPSLSVIAHSRLAKMKSRPRKISTVSPNSVAVSPAA